MNGFALEILRRNKDKINRVALVDKNGTRKITWESLVNKICCVAAYARKQGLCGVIPVCMERGMEVTATLLGLNLAGVGIAPLAVTTPASRCENIAARLGNDLWTMETFQVACECTPAYELCSDGKEADPACVLFTSGSTGTPKGVLLGNRAMLSVMQRAAGPDIFNLDENSKLLQSASLSFVLAYNELFAPLYAGATVYILPEEARKDLHRMEDFINRHGITGLAMPPQLYRNFSGGPSLRRVCLAGDKIVRIAPKGHQLVGAYGMTETAGIIFHVEIKEPLSSVPLGVPCGDTKAYVLDEQGNEAEEGELCLSGALADGYFEQEELSKATFTDNPFSDDPDFSTLLHTGDLVRRTQDGNFFYLSRKDNMIKINGQRVEPGEIETVLMDYPGIDTAVAKGFTDENQRGIICAYYICNRSVDEEKMKAYLAEKLPHYMVPSIFVKMDNIPLNQNGKIDRKALKMPDLSQYLGEYEKPVGEAEELLCKAFAKVLGIQNVGRNDDFFRLGGDSIAALSLVYECNKLGLSTGDVFAGRTPKSIAGILREGIRNVYADLPTGINKTKLTDSQMGVFLECGLEEESTKYDIPVQMSFARTENMNLTFVKNAVDRVIKNHPALYAGILAEDGEFFMVRQAFPEEGICEAVDVSGDKEAPTLERALPIALGRDPLCRAKAYLGRDTVRVFMNMHHIVSDGSSVAVIAEQIKCALRGEKLHPETVDSFSLYEAECRLKNTKAYEESKTYYEHLLSGVETDSNLIYDHKPAENAEPVGTRKTTMLPMEDIKSYLEKNGVTENTFFMGVFGYVLAKMTGQNESVFCVAENGRENALLKDTVSMLVKTLPVVLKIDEEKAGSQLLAELQTQFFATMRNDSVGFKELAEEYGIHSDVMFVYQSDMLDGIDLAETGESLSHLSLSVLKRSEAYELSVEYRTDLYENDTIDRFIRLFKRAADAFVRGIALKDTVLISDEDKAFLDEENVSNCHELKKETILDIFKKTVAKHPEKTALLFGEKEYTFTDVDRISDRIAAYLAEQGLGKGKVVSVLIPRNEYMLLASMGVMKAGATYQPLDPSYPKERLSFMMKDAKVSLVIADRKLVPILTDYTGGILYTDEIPGLPEGEAELPKPSPDDIYTLLYTSGTTGTPKGVMLSHGNLSAFVTAQAIARELEEDSVVAQYASYGFDAHMHEFYPPLLLGCTVAIVPDEIRLDLEGVKNFCETHGVTHLFMTTQVARQFATAYPEVKGLKVLDTGGEKLVSFIPKNTYKINNLYGPTEGTVCSTKFVVDKYYDNIPIGKAIYNYRLYVADAYGRRMPIGVPGELIQCGPQVSQGYLGRPDLTEKVFVPNTFENAGENYERCYKTGDIVRFVRDGNIEYIGRRDHQVKIRGFRIEPGEVEKTIRDYPGIKDATIAVVDGTSGKNLCAYIVSDKTVDINDLNRFIGKKLPAYMVPAVTMQIDSIPLNVNGKVDKKKLPAPKIVFDDVTKPENELQQQIFDCVAEATGTDEFGIATDIFTAGLSSIGSIRLCTLLANKFGVPVKIRDLKKYPTVAELEKFIRPEEPKAEDITDGEKGCGEDRTFGPVYPITKTMEGIFTECLQRPESTVYNIPYLMKLGPGIDENRLKKAVAAAVEAHPCMKAELFTDKDGKVCQHRKLKDTYTAEEVKTVCLSGKEECNDRLVTPFELTGSRLFEINILHADGLYLFVNIHHILSDGTSMTVFLRDIEKAYGGEQLQAETYSGFDVAEEEKKSRTEKELAEEKAYYEALLNGTDKDFLLIPDKTAEAPEAEGKLSLGQIEADADVIRKFCEKNRLSMNAYFVSVFGTVLAAYAGMDYSVFNTIYNGRNDSRAENTVAMLVKTMPVVCRVDKDSVCELTEEMAGQLMDSMSNDLYSYAEISRDFGVKNDVMFIFQGDGFTRNSFCGEPAEEVPLNLSESKMPLSLQVMVRNGRLVYELEYDPKRYTEELAKAFVLAFDRAAASFAEAESLSKVSFLSDAAEAEMERHNATETEYDKTKTIADFFTERAKQQPDDLCVSYKGKEYTYGEIDGLTAKLSYFLMEKGIGRGDIVAILINRDENMVIGAHGVIRAGAAYLGLDPTYPSERLDFMLKDSGAKYLIADRSLMHVLREYKGNRIYTDEIAGLKQPSAEEFQALASSGEHKATPEDNALIVYSSGTTGLPKGSILRHRNIVCFYHNYTKRMDIVAHSHVATYASFGFDGGAMDVFCVPMAGAVLYVIPDEIRLDLSSLEQFYVRNGITSGFMTTQVGCMFIANTKCRTLKEFIVGGEKLIPVLGPDWIHFCNGYGPSETMCYVNHYEVKNTGSLQPIGKVSGNTKEYIIDKYGRRLPYGACGELCISGGQVGKGYLGRPEKTAEVFVKNPFSNAPEYSVMYRTGDIARLLPDGNYDFVGRRDGQVKIRGFRIELGEIELQIRMYPGVTNAVVRAYDYPSGGKYLAAYVVADEELDTEDLKNFIGKEKPDYMIPTAIIRMDSLPLTSNGKVDMGKLPKPELGTLKKGTEPANETEEALCGIFEDIIGIDKVYADDDFFKIGGSSISAIQVVVRCEQSGYPVVYKDLFTNPTPQKLAAFIAGEKTKDVTASELNKDGKYDYSALKYNVIPNLPNIRDDGVGDVLLTGATGFLGSHIFRELMDSASGRVICLVRGKEKMLAEFRLESMLVYYFDDWYREEIKQRTVVIDAELEDEDILEKLGDIHFDTIINCAANVKHFAVEREMISANFSGVENLIRLAEKTGARLIQISSMSVCGESVNGSVPVDYIFRETDLNIGQSLENKYVYSKYLGEQAIIDAISRKRIHGKVIRLGNLMARVQDGIFQANAKQNALIRLYIGCIKLRCFPVDMLDSKIEFSPIDKTAKAVVLLSGTPDEFTMFHAVNCNEIHYSYFLQAIRDAGYPIEIVESSVFEERLKKALENPDNVTKLAGLLAYRNSTDASMNEITRHTGDDDFDKNEETRIRITTSNTFTTKALYRLGFAWPLISMDYMKQMVKMLSDLNFFEV